MEASVVGVCDKHRNDDIKVMSKRLHRLLHVRF